MTGEGNFNWRFIFPFNYQRAEERIIITRKVIHVFIFTVRIGLHLLIFIGYICNMKTPLPSKRYKEILLKVVEFKNGKPHIFYLLGIFLLVG
jgi:hypothetical protein